MPHNEQDSLREIVMLLAILVKRQAIPATTIKEMADVGFTPKRIAELVGTTPNSVSVTLSKSRKPRKSRGSK